MPRPSRSALPNSSPRRSDAPGSAPRRGNRALALYGREKVTADLAALCAGFLRRDGSP